MTLFDKPTEESCIRCPTVYCRTHPCTQAQGVRCCGACPYRQNCKSKCECLTPDVK